MIHLKTPGSADVIDELVQDNREILDELIHDSSPVFNWLLTEITEQPKSVDDKFLALLSAFCVCGKIAIRAAQVCCS